MTMPTIYRAELSKSVAFEEAGVVWEGFGLDPEKLYALLTEQALEVAPDHAWSGTKHMQEARVVEFGEDVDYTACFTTVSLDC